MFIDLKYYHTLAIFTLKYEISHFHLASKMNIFINVLICSVNHKHIQKINILIMKIKFLYFSIFAKVQAILMS